MSLANTVLSLLTATREVEERLEDPSYYQDEYPEHPIPLASRSTQENAACPVGSLVSEEMFVFITNATVLLWNA